MGGSIQLQGLIVRAALISCASAMAVGCAIDPDRGEAAPLPPPAALPPSPAPEAPLPQASGIYSGQYRVPASGALAQAAQFTVDSVDWSVVGSAITLHYNLPVGLVGGHVPITLTGQLDSGSKQLMLAGDHGIGLCVATAFKVVCQEAFSGLGSLPISQTIVEKTAAKDYVGPIAERVAVATVFASDPIGTIDIDLTKPVVDDRGGDGSGGDGSGDD